MVAGFALNETSVSYHSWLRKDHQREHEKGRQNIALVLINSLQLCFSGQNCDHLIMDGGRLPEVSPLPEGLLTVDGCWGGVNFLSGVVTDQSPTVQ